MTVMAEDSLNPLHNSSLVKACLPFRGDQKQLNKANSKRESDLIIEADKGHASGIVSMHGARDMHTKMITKASH